jgi:hypothetical protein
VPSGHVLEVTPVQDKPEENYWHIWYTADWWPDWEGIDTCQCGQDLDDIDGYPDRCPKCGLELIELVYPHCVRCEEMIVGMVHTDPLNDDYCITCAESVTDK